MTTIPDNVRPLRPAERRNGEPAPEDEPGRDLAVPDPDDVAVRGETAVVEWEPPAAPLPRVLAVIVIRTREVASDERARTAARHAAYIPIGAGVVAKRIWEAKTNSRFERVLRSIEATGNLEALAEWTDRAEQARDRRHRRRWDLVEAPAQVAKGLAVATGTVLVILIVLGVVVAVADHNPRELGAPLMGVIHAIRDLVWLVEVTWGPVVAASPAMLAGYFWHVGRTSGAGPRWLIGADGEGAGAVVTADGIVLALQHMQIPQITRALTKEGWIPKFHQPPRRDGRGYWAVVELPLGVTPEMVADKRALLARNLHRAEIETWPADAEKVDTGPAGYLDLWIADPGALSKAAPEYPLLHEGAADVFEGVPGGVSPRGDRILIPIVSNNFVAGGQMGQGKALALDTPVPTPTGWTTMGELVEGDLVFDENGQPCRVTIAWPVRRDRPCYQVEFSDGATIVADAEHLWRVDTRASRVSESAAATPKRRDSPYSHDQSHKRSMPRVLTTAEMATSVLVGPAKLVNYSVRVAEPLAGADTELPVAPYTLGAWLGDGHSASGMITCRDPEIIAEIQAEGEHAYRLACSDGKCPLWRVEGLTKRLRLLGALHNKHIPLSYMRASEQQRRALLAGLLDTDGYCDKTGTVQFSVTSERLAQDVRHLVSTLGYKSRLRPKPARLNGKDCGTAWIVTFTPGDPVFRMPRKVARQVVAVRASARHRYITAIRPVDSVPVRCITVDSPNSLYLVGETCIATHNSNACRVILLGCALDPLCIIDAFVFANNGDFDAYKPRLANYYRGTEDDVAKAALARLRWLYEEVGRREGRLAELGSKKLTRKIAQKHPDLRPIVSLYSECHELFGHKEFGEEAGELACKTAKRGRKTGIVLGFDTQSSRKEAIPPKLVELVSVNICFYAKTWRVNDGFLGDGCFQAGIRATELRPGRDRGTSLIIGVSDASFELLKWYFVAVDDDTGWDAATDVIARAVADLAPGTPATNGAAAIEKPVERDLLEDLEAVLGEETVPAADLPALLARYAPDWVPYRKLTGKALRDLLAREHGVKVPSTNNRWPVSPKLIADALAWRRD